MDYRKISIVVLLLILVFALMAVVAMFGEFKYSNELDGTLFVSNFKKPNDLLAELSAKKTFIVSPALHPSGNINSYTANASNLAVVVLIGNDKNTVQLRRIFDSNNSIISCNNNSGNPKTDELLSPSQCSAFLDSAKSINAVKLLIEFPNPSLEKPLIVLNENEIAVKPKTYLDVSGMVFTLLKAIYPNSVEIVGNVNVLLGKVK